MAKTLRIGAIFILALTIILSCTVVGSKLTDPVTYTHTIEALDANRTTVLGLSAASAAASAAVSALPDDICSPLAEEISEFTSWFLMILSVIYLEKYLLTIFGAVACYFLLPIGCGVLLANCFFPRSILQSIGSRLIALGAVLLLVIPSSVWVSDQVNAIYAQSIEVTVASANAVSDNLVREIGSENEENTTVIDEAKAILGDVTGSVASVIDQFRNMLSRFIEATAVMIVTTCLILILVILFFFWITKLLFHVQITVPSQPIKPSKKRYPDDAEYSRS